jgi:hypothetical protein
MTNKQKFLELVSNDLEPSKQFMEMLKFRIDNREEIKRSQQIALKILNKLDDLNITKKELSLFCNVEIDEITKLVSGQSIDLDNNLLSVIEKYLNIDLK